MLKHCGTETLDKTSTDIESAAAAAEMPLKPIKTSDSLPDKRIKPVVPAKPAFIPPPPTGRQPHHRTPVVLNDNPVSVSAPVQPAIVPGFVVPSSPNIGCGSSDCCGILSGGTAKQNDNQSTHPPANNNNNNNNNSNQNNNRNGAAAVASVDQPDHCVGGETERRWCRSTSSEQDRTCAQLDAIKKKTMDLDSRLPHKFYEDRRAVQSPASSSSAAVPPNRNNMQNKFFQQSSKQLEQILAQRIEKETLVAAAAAGKTNKKRFGGSASAQTVPVVGTQAAATSAQVTADSTAISTIQKQIQHKLHDEMKKHCKTIQEKHLIEKRWPQQPYRPSTGADCDLQQTVQRYPPVIIGLKILPKLKPTKFGTLDEQLEHNQQHHSRKGSTEQGISVSSSDTSNGGDDHSLVYRDGHLISGSLATMIQHMVPTADYYPDKSYLFAFLLSARLFIRPHELLERVCHICDIQQELPVALCGPAGTVAATAGAQVSTAIQQQSWCRFAAHFVRLLSEWIETFPYDFRDERLMQHVRTMTQKCINIDAMLRKDVSAMLQDLLHRLTVLDHYEEYLGRISCIVEAKDERLCASSSSSGITVQSTGGGSSSGSSSTALVNALSASSSLSIGGQSAGDITELCPSSTHLAHQLTHIELERLSHIGPEEFVQAFAKENPQLETSINDMKKTRNLESYVQWFNRLSYLVATEIVKHTKKKQRIRVVEYWIETAKESFNIGNFNSLMAIIAGLNMSPISRLKKTWAKVQSAQFSVLEHQMDPTSNFNSYRSTLKAAMWRSAGATDERQRIVIPFFSLLVKDLYFLNEGCSNKLPNGHINFDKFWQLAKQVTEFIGWKQVTCTFDKQSKVTMFLQTNHVLNENTLAMASFECEPPDNAHEKDRYKALKAEYYSNSQPTGSGGDK